MVSTITTLLVQIYYLFIHHFPYVIIQGWIFIVLVIRNRFVNFHCFPLLLYFFARFKLLNKVTYLSALKIPEENGRGDSLFLTAMGLCTTMGIRESRYAI